MAYSDPDDGVILTGLTVVDGVEPVSESGFAGLQSNVDTQLAWPYIRLLLVVVGLIVVAGVSGAHPFWDTVVFCLVATAVTAVVILLPALVRRMGLQPEGREVAASGPLDMLSLSISSDRLLVARSRRTGLDVDERLRPRLRGDLDILLKTRHGLDLEHPEHGPRIEAIIGAEAWDLIRVDRAPRPAWAGIRHQELETILTGCLEAVRGPGRRTDRP